ncbi:DUF3999 domain-containing protein [Luteimonas sp. XNQY3]|nr:DUF3999 family protein [Luteimonas sp. XNQY3]MCD9008130.1 DUF3999 domain-containing protein [Luteimonas sp. XNQY3]
MNRTLKCMAALTGGVLCSVAIAAVGDDAFVAQWPLTLPASDAGAYQVELDDAVYATAVSPALCDLVVVNGDGRQVPALLQSAPPPAARRTTQTLAWFPLPATAARSGSDIAAISELDPDGRLRRIQWQPAPGDAPPAALLVDASASELPLQALVLDWGDADAAFERTMRVEGSGDLRDWQPLPAGGRLLDLRRGEARLVERRIVFDTPVRARYLRLTPGAGAGTMPAIVSVTGESPAVTDAPVLQWRALEPAGAADADGGFVFRLDARLPVTHVDLGLDGNATARWTLSVRGHDAAPWRTIASDWLVYRIGAEAAARTPPLALEVASRERQWRLVPDAPSAGAAPVLRLGYRPERLVFVAEGAAPFSLRAGSGRSVRVDAAVAPLLADLRARNGGRWAPAVATLGARAELAGAAALDDTPPRDWGTWLLWSVLLLGVLLVGGFALRLLRAPKPG